MPVVPSHHTKDNAITLFSKPQFGNALEIRKCSYTKQQFSNVRFSIMQAKVHCLLAWILCNDHYQPSCRHIAKKGGGRGYSQLVVLALYSADAEIHMTHAVERSQCSGFVFYENCVNQCKFLCTM